MSAHPIDDGTEPTEHDPDVRFTYANERTLLAWNRTALALVVAGVAATQVLPSFGIEGARKLIGIPLMALGGIIAVLSYRRWILNERAMRRNEPLPPSYLPMVLTVGVAIVALICLVVVIVGDA